MPSQPSLHSQECWSSLLGSRALPSARESQRGREQSSPPNPAGQEHFPLYLLQSANWVQVSDSLLQSKHEGQAGQPSGRSSRKENFDCDMSARDELRYAVESHGVADIKRAARRACEGRMCLSR